MRKRYTEEQRLKLLEMVGQGQSTKAVASQLGVHATTAYNWVRYGRKGGDDGQAGGAQSGASKARRMSSAPRFARLVAADEAVSGIVVGVGGAEIKVKRGFDVEVLRAAVAALREQAT